jgi:DNA helicase IV
MNSAISSDIDKLPTDAEDGYCKIELMNFLTEDIPFTIKLNDNDDYYGVEPIIDVLKKRGRKNLTINIKKKKDYKVEHAQLVPELRFKIIYEYNNGKDSIIGKALNYWGK